MLIDAMEPWTIKGVTTETRKRVIAAARKEGLTVGQWLERRVNGCLDHQELHGLVQIANGSISHACSTYRSASFSMTCRRR
jgi:hypothetical protein